MAWGKIDDKLYSSPKWMLTTKGGKALWVSALSWCMAQLTDGAVTKQTCFMLGATTRDARSLVEAGLWDETPNGYQFHDWLDYQPSREQVLAERESARQRQQRARGKSVSSPQSHGVTNGVTHSEVQPLVTGDVTGPPSRPVPSPKESASRKRSTPLPREWKPSASHADKCTTLHLEVTWEATKFKDNAEAKGLKYVDWDKAFHTWLNRANDFKPQHAQNQQTDLWSKEGPF